jgi:hypothetical protein
LVLAVVEEAPLDGCDDRAPLCRVLAERRQRPRGRTVGQRLDVSR